jgi:hypothetical protein
VLKFEALHCAHTKHTKFFLISQTKMQRVSLHESQSFGLFGFDYLFTKVTNGTSIFVNENRLNI